ncbi:MAG: ABC transporter ATP-binding protein [Treponema sp.]|nr:ABC transporter ATP-binding protein [Treponema sp.]
MNVIELTNICKQYPGKEKKANNNISLQLRKGEILCITGENGAGKTTLMKILCGLEKNDSGCIKVNGNIGMVHQHFMLFPEYKVSENIVMGNEPRKWGVFFDSGKAKKISEEIILDNNFSIKPDVKVKELTLGERQQVEICRVLYQNADIIILDEPTSILTEQEINSLFITLKKLRSKGKSIIFITHKLNEIKQISDRVMVLRRGELAGVRDISEINVDEIAGMMVNSEINNINTTFLSFNKQPEKPGKDKIPVISFENVTVLRRGQKRPLLENVSFSACSGEILGFAGVGGNGLGVIEAVLGGFLHPYSGKIIRKGKDISKLSIRSLREQGLAYVPADRINVGSARDATIEENILINRRKEYKSIGVKNSLLGFLNNIINKYNIEGSYYGAKVSTLSGGNLQKLILAREIDQFKEYIVFSEPTWGLDITSSRFVMEEIINLRNKGAAIILISTNLDEILTLSDRIIVMYRGKIIGEYINNGDNSTREMIGKNMQGLS